MECLRYTTELRFFIRFWHNSIMSLQWKMGLISDEEYSKETVIYGRINKGWARGGTREAVLTRMRIKHDLQARISTHL